MNRHDYTRIPDHMMYAIEEYVNRGIPLGGFLNAVFTNDLFRACSRADADNLEIIPIYVAYIYNHCPHSCHGSEEIVEQWIKEKQEKKKKE